MVPEEQRRALLSFAEACNTRIGKLGQDARGDWRISGARGFVYAISRGFLLLVTAPAWDWAKDRLLFGEVMRDGAVILDRLPSPAEASEIRSALGITHRHPNLHADVVPEPTMEG